VKTSLGLIGIIKLVEGVTKKCRRKLLGVLLAHRRLAGKTIAVLVTLCHERASPTSSLGTDVLFERQ
jgi:hypothetical protein